MHKSIVTDNIREQLGNGNFVCGIFVDLHKAFGTVDHDILIQKLNHKYQTIGFRHIIRTDCNMLV